jgi:hypothetical protein
MRRRTQTGAAALVALLGGAVGVAGCNFIVGVGDYSIADGSADGTNELDGEVGPDVAPDRPEQIDGADTGIDGSVDAPADGSNDRTDAARDAAGDVVPVDAGDAGRETGGGDGGVPDSGGATDADARVVEAEAGPPCGQGLPVTQTAFRDLVNACVLAISCDPYLFPISLSDCITLDALHATPYYSCLSTITSCTGASNSYYACQGLRLATLAATECPGITSKCTGNVAFDCSGVVPFSGANGLVTNCNLLGGTCTTYTDLNSNSRADCLVVPTCTVSGSGLQCSGNNLYACTPLTMGASTGIGVGNTCSANATCTTTASGGTDCYPNGSATCTAPGTASCNGGTMQSCSVAGQTFDYDCTQAGGTCATGGATGAACVSPGCSATTQCAEACNTGTGVITACVGGAQYSIDCTQYGFTGCNMSGTLVYCQ